MATIKQLEDRCRRVQRSLDKLLEECAKSGRELSVKVGVEAWQINATHGMRNSVKKIELKVIRIKEIY
jgi:hypothetical protein